MTLIRQFVIVACLAAVAAGGWLALAPMLGAGDSEAKRRGGGGGRASAVVVQPIETGVERIRVEAVGTARAKQSATLFPATAGEVEAVNFTTDGIVAQGDVLLELDREQERLSVELARVRLTDAERVFKRFQSLRKTGAIAQSQLDDARTTLQAARIELQRAEVALSDRFVVAPFAGHIGLTELDVGDRIGPDTEVATLDDRSSLLIRFAVPEALLGRIKIGDTVTVAAWATPDGEVEGAISDVGSRVSERNRTFAVRATIPNPEDAIRPGMSFRVTLDVTGTKHPKVPEIAIQWGGAGSYLWAIREGKARRVPVLIVQRQGASVLVEADLDTGDMVVVEGLHRMRDGGAVEIIDGAGTEAPAVPATVQGVGS